MKPPSAQSLDLSRRLLAWEAARAKKPGGHSPATPLSHAELTRRVIENLRSVITVFAGAAGFQSLLARALTLAQSQQPALAAVRILLDGTLSGLEAVNSPPPKRATSAAKGEPFGALLIGQLLDLLIIFVGESLTLQLILNAWPDLPKRALRLTKRNLP